MKKISIIILYKLCRLEKFLWPSFIDYFSFSDLYVNLNDSSGF
jgi:hypothetical protein